MTNKGPMKRFWDYLSKEMTHLGVGVAFWMSFTGMCVFSNYWKLYLTVAILALTWITCHAVRTVLNEGKNKNVYQDR